MLDIFQKASIISNVPSLEDLCNGSTPDSDSVCGGSNPSSSATKDLMRLRRVFSFCPAHIKGAPPSRSAPYCFYFMCCSFPGTPPGK